MKQIQDSQKIPAKFRFSEYSDVLFKQGKKFAIKLPILCWNLEMIGKRNETEFETVKCRIMDFDFWLSVLEKKSCDQTVHKHGI